MPRLLFGPFNPDQPGHLNNGLLTAQNVYSSPGGYRPVKAFVASGDALPAECLGAASFRSASDLTYLFAGTADGLYRRVASGWTQLGSDYSTPTEKAWTFQQFGENIIATNGTNAPQRFDMATPTTFIDLPGSPPTMEMLAVVKDFLVGGVIDGDTARIQWSGINNSEFWTPGQNQSDYNIFPAGGKVTGIAGGQYGVVFQERRISRMEYSGDDTVFQFQEISASVGCVAPRSLAQFGNTTFFLSDQGFASCDGQGINFIGNETVDRTFLNAVTRGFYNRMSSAIDPINKLVIFTEPSSNDPQRWWVYSITQQRWTTIEQGADRVFSGFSADTTLEDLDTLYSSMDTMDVSFDSALWLGGTPALFVIDNAHTLGTMSGANMAATLGMGDLELAPGYEARWSRVRPLGDMSGGVTLTLGGRVRLGDTLTATNYAAFTDSGDMAVREAWRYIRPTLTMGAGAAWTFLQGYDVTATRGGSR